MENNYTGEKWKSVVFDFEFVNNYRIQISNFGRVKTFNKISDGNILKGSMINGYKIIRLKFFKARDAEVENKMISLRRQVSDLSKRIKLLEVYLTTTVKEDPVYITKQDELNTTSLLLAKLKKDLAATVRHDFKSRTIHYHSLIHRLVAQYFITPPSAAHSIVAHLDYNKLNNERSNLTWMTPEQNYLHQRFSPNVISSKIYEGGRRKEDARSTKLSVTKVMLLKKLVNEGKSMRALVKQFRVTNTQILRIQRGENWPEVQAAP